MWSHSVEIKGHTLAPPPDELLWQLMPKGKSWVTGGTTGAAARVELKVIFAERRQLILRAWLPGNS